MVNAGCVKKSLSDEKHKGNQVKKCMQKAEKKIK
jgi:hypothetical protein